MELKEEEIEVIEEGSTYDGPLAIEAPDGFGCWGGHGSYVYFS